MDPTKVLIVDDEQEFAAALSERLEARGFRVDTAATGDDAAKKVQDRGYDAILLDLVMPGMDGIETLKRLLQVRPELQIILLTGHATLEKGIQAVKLGALDFLEKPADFDQLLQRIEAAKSNRLALVEKKCEDTIEQLLMKKPW